jgi:hypothetical protein
MLHLSLERSVCYGFWLVDQGILYFMSLILYCIYSLLCPMFNEYCDRLVVIHFFIVCIDSWPAFAANHLLIWSVLFVCGLRSLSLFVLFVF